MKKRRKARPGQPERKQRKSKARDAFEPESCWVEWGGEMIWAVDFTEGGAPYGLTREEYCEAMGLPPEQECDDPGIF